jgi:hypothetical protein
MKSVTVRLNQAEWGALQGLAEDRHLSPTRLATELLQCALAPEPGVVVAEPVPLESCVRSDRHEPGVRCPLCQGLSLDAVVR